MVTPASLGSDLRFWLRADLGVSKIGADVTGWKDQASVGVQYNQLTFSPQYVASAINGQPGIDFSAANRTLGWTSGALAIAAPWTWVAVFKESLTPGAYGVAGGGWLVTGTTVGCTIQSETANSHYLYTYTGPIGDALAIPTATMEAGVAGRLSTSATTPQHSLAGQTGTVTGSDVTLTIGETGGRIGLISAGGGTLTICEIIIVGKATDCAELRPYILNKYGLTLA